MDLHLSSLRPDFLSSQVYEESDLWDKKITWHAGSSIGIYGPSGRGKSTFLRILYGLEQKYAGSFSWGTDEIRKEQIDPWPRLRRSHLSIVLQDFHLLPELNGWQQLELLPGFKKEALATEIDFYCQHLDIGHCMDRPLSTWSKGQQQRMAIVRALASPAEWILMDEPFSHLDQKNTEKAAELIDGIARKWKCGYILTHLNPSPEMSCSLSFRI